MPGSADRAGQEKKAGWPVVEMARKNGGPPQELDALQANGYREGEAWDETETYVPESTVKGLVEALEVAEEFVERVDRWTGHDECEQAETLEEIQAALSSYKQEVE